jgi:hypothetical protein
MDIGGGEMAMHCFWKSTVVDRSAEEAPLANRETTCASCKAVNRIGPYSVALIPRCGKCQAALPETASRKAIRQIYRFRRFSGIAAIAGIILIILWNASPEKPTSVALARKEPVPASCVAVSRPRTGVYRNYDLSPDLAAPLEIRTAAGANYFVKLEDSITREPIQTFFIRSGQTMKSNVPLGHFVLKYATGDAWCGEDDMFGTETEFHKADVVLRFARQGSDDGYTMIGHTVELILQANGNLKTSRISREEFWHKPVSASEKDWRRSWRHLCNFSPNNILSLAKLVRKNGAAGTGAERELFIRKSNSFVACVRLTAKDRGGICLDGFDWTSLTPDWGYIDEQVQRLATPQIASPPLVPGLWSPSKTETSDARRYLVTNKLPISTALIDEPGMSSALEIWEQFLAEVKAMPESAQKPQTILHAEYMIALKREELEPMPSNLPFLGAFIDPPGRFGDTLKEWEQFLVEMEELPDSVQKRQTVNNAKQMIAMKMRDKFWA